VGAAVVGRSDGAEPLLAGGVPLCSWSADDCLQAAFSPLPLP
jgi:hypothetical protein